LLAKVVAYNEFDDISEIEEYYYDDQNRIIKNIHRDHDSIITYLFNFNENNQIDKYQIINREGITLQDTTRVYVNGQLISSTDIIFSPVHNRKDVVKTRYEEQ
jgi:hypothetical protein